MSTDEQPDLSFLEGFAPASAEAWRELVGDPDKLRTATHEGIDLEALYTREDAPESSGFPGLAPFTRGSRAVVAPWEAAIEVHVAEPDAARVVADGLAREATAIRLRTDDGEATEEALAAVLVDAPLPETAVWLEATEQPLVAAQCLARVAEGRRVSPAVLRGGFSVDPLGELAGKGQLAKTLPASLRTLAEVTRWSLENTPGMRAATVSMQPYHDMGASAVEELAFAMATAVEYLRTLEHEGIAIGDAAGQMAFSYSVSGKLFMEIAKLRAGRLLWSKVLKACRAKPLPEHVYLMAHTSRRTKTRHEPWVNVLRGTAEAFAAIVGGAELLVVAPLDEALGAPADRSRRLALGTHMVLRHEAHLGRVTDPAGGSFAVEHLTDQLAREAWQLFQDIEERGGMAKAVGAGLIAEHMGNTYETRRSASARRQDPIVGISQFPHLDGQPPSREPSPWAAPAVRRDAEEFEALRDRSDAWQETHGERPRAVILGFVRGPLGAHAARLAFTLDVLAAGGFEPMEAEVDSADDARAAAQGAVMAVLCSTDEAYDELVPAVAPVLGDEGIRFVAVAGQPGENADAWRKAGVSLFLRRGMDVPAAFAPVWDALEGNDT